MFVKTLYITFLLTYTAAIRVQPSYTAFNANHNTVQHIQSYQNSIKIAPLHYSNLPHSAHTHEAQSAPVFSSSHGAPRPYSSISKGHHASQKFQKFQATSAIHAAQNMFAAPVQYATKNVYAAPAVHGAQIVYAAPAVHDAQNIYATPDVHGAQNVYAAPAVHGVQHGNVAPAVHGAQHVYAAPAVHGAQNVYAAPAVHGAQNVYGAPAVHGAQHVHAAPAVHGASPAVHGAQHVHIAPAAFHSASVAPASQFSASAAIPSKQYSFPVTSHAAPFSNKAHYEEEYASPKYEFAYGVEDHHTGDIHLHKETRDGDFTKGEYSLHDADGTIRTVKYTVDKHSGFNAVVERSGQPNHQQAAAHHQAPQYHH